MPRRSRSTSGWATGGTTAIATAAILARQTRRMSQPPDNTKLLVISFDDALRAQEFLQEALAEANREPFTG
jgi:hypothetical protein